MEGIVAVIMIIIGVVNFVQKQQKEQDKRQGGMKTQQHGVGQKPLEQRRYTAQPPRRTAPLTKEDFLERLGIPLESLSEQPASAYESEGLEAEDRSRVGSLDYAVEVQSLEGTCNEHPEHEEKKREENKPISKEALTETDEKPIFDLTEENLLRSIIMAEVIGPPRSMKRNIR